MIKISKEFGFSVVYTAYRMGNHEISSHGGLDIGCRLRHRGYKREDLGSVLPNNYIRGFASLYLSW